MLRRTKKRLLIGLTCAFAAASIACVASACGEEQVTFQPVTVYHSDSTFVSPSGIALGGGNIYVSDATANKLYRLNDEGKVVNSYSFDDAVNGVYAAGDDVYALVGGLAGEVYRFDKALTLQAKAEAEHTPTDALLVGERLYVANRFSNSVSVFDRDLTQGKVIALEEGREPMALTEAQGKVFVACHLPKGPAGEEVVSSTLVVIDPEEEEVSANIRLQNGTGGVKDITTSSDGNYVYLSCLFERYSYPTSQLDRGWSNTNGFAIVDAAKEEVYAGVLVDNVDRGAANPWGIDVIGEGANAKIVVGISGLSEISIVNEQEMMKKLVRVEEGEFDYSLDQVIDHAEFSADIAERFDVGGNGLRSVALAEEEGVQYAYTAQYFDGTVAKVPLESEEASGEREVEVYEIGRQGELTAERLGEILWHDADYFYQGWETCASCHPAAHPDGFNWDEGNDGLGNAKSTKSMLYAHRTPPNLVSGLKENGEIAVRESVQTFYEEDYLDCIDAFLRSMKPVQSPYLNRDGSLTQSAQRGEELFREYGCNVCHSAPLYTDLQPHKSPSLEVDDTWEDRAMDTPTLVEIWRTGPYMFNGSAVTMEDAVRHFVGARPITDEQVKDLAQFILSIGDNGEIYGVEEVFFDKEDGSGECAMRLVAGRTITRVTVRKQWDDARDALVKLTLCDEGGNELAEPVYALLKGMVKGDYAQFSCRVPVPKNLSQGSYYEITITDADDQSEPLATPLRVYADGRYYSQNAAATSVSASEELSKQYERPAEALPAEEEKLLPTAKGRKEERS